MLATLHIPESFSRQCYISAACAYIGKKTSIFLLTPLPSTGMPPHVYITADKSTNHQVTNQVTVICPVVNGRREGIVLNAREVYTNSDGTGGTGEALAKSIYSDLEKKCWFERNIPSPSATKSYGWPVCQRPL